MKELSLWAQQHKWPARIILIFSHIALTLISIYWGFISFQKNIVINEAALYLLIIFYFLLYLLYPSGGKQHFFQNTYKVRLLFHGAMAVCSVLLVVTYVNSLQHATHMNTATASVIKVRGTNPGYNNPEAERLVKGFQSGEIKKFSKSERRILKEELKYQFHSYKKAKEAHQKKDATNAVIIILTIIGALIMLYLVAALSCSLSCNGNEAASVIVLVLGVAAIIFGCVAIGRSLKKKKKATAPATQ